MRAETGKMQFTDDWSGVFIRGDVALMLFYPALKGIISGKPGLLDMTVLESMAELMRSAEEHNGMPAQQAELKPEPDNDSTKT